MININIGHVIGNINIRSIKALSDSSGDGSLIYPGTLYTGIL